MRGGRKADWSVHDAKRYVAEGKKAQKCGRKIENE